MNLGFGDALLVLGVLLAVAAALSGVMRGTVLSISVLSVALGIGLAEAGVVSVTATSPGIADVIEIALILTLFSDGSRRDVNGRNGAARSRNRAPYAEPRVRPQRRSRPPVRTVLPGPRAARRRRGRRGRQGHR